MAGFGFSPNSFHDARVTMMTCELPISVAMPMPMNIIELWYESMSGARIRPAPKAIQRVREERVSELRTRYASSARAGRAYSIRKNDPVDGLVPEKM
jgi:hypothetical protein